MDLRQLTSLVAIADHGTFSAAARALYTVQSNVSGHIARLERELGVLLVDRQRGGLTDEGLVVVERARRVLHELDDISAEMASRGDEVRGDTRLGVIGTTARWLLPQMLTQLAKQHPGVHVTVHEGNTTNLLPRLLAQQLDATIVHLPVDDPEVSVEPLFAEDLVLLVHTRHHLAGHESIALADLAGEPLMLPPIGAALRRAIDRAAANVGVELLAQVEIDGVRLLTSLAFEGFGAAIVPATAVPRWLKGDFRRIAVPELPRRVVGWVQRRRPSPGSPTRALQAVLRDVIATQGAKQPGLYVGADAFPLGRSV
ncbi:MAG: LysR family transcriptional regulator [Ilumatobacteraceae bacterium]|nr:LysR family transcriptional regulator [Ilumatobacteraceae bacterium]MBP7890644.1 LysR family transcriptional regulator [Ilumatobacteraceae bacterium]MBP8208476.1 LysR family transcriptional regulator [Ilumatobacteraceae bacterium]HQY16108.1 LysR family transcriptional regulator [Ilumatobacteraceae bacterium]HQY86239.1 LysR family transcriptional regulator [Ilumatobacteraceae bacterium]